jgi:RES domain-containing protein
MASQHKGLHAFRIADQRHPILDGTGTFLQGSRWISRGRRVIHASESYAASLLEMLVHCNTGQLPKTLSWIDITYPDRYGVSEIRAAEIPNWNGFDIRATRAAGDRWHEERRTLILLVPSVVTAGVERNVLINQDHPGFRYVRATPPAAVQWDARLFRTATAESTKKGRQARTSVPNP